MPKTKKRKTTPKIGVMAQRKANIEAAEKLRRDCVLDGAKRAAEMGAKIGEAADDEAFKALKDGGMPIDGARVALIRLGMQRAGRLVEKKEITGSIDRPLRDATDDELLALVEKRKDDK